MSTTLKAALTQAPLATASAKSRFYRPELDVLRFFAFIFILVIVIVFVFECLFFAFFFDCVNRRRFFFVLSLALIILHMYGKRTTTRGQQTGLRVQ